MNVNATRTREVTQWLFALSDTPDARTKGYDDSEWRAVTVPHDWSVEQEFSAQNASGTGYLPGGIGWYRAHVPLSELALTEDAHVEVRFGGVYKNADVWVNGYHLGGRPNGHVPFSFDLTEIVAYAPDDDLVISVRVDRTEIADSRWYNGAGITRAVTIDVDAAVRVIRGRTAFTTLAADAASADIRIEQAIANDRPGAAAVRVRHELRSLATGRAYVFETDRVIDAGGSAPVVVDGRVPEPELWSDADPALYRLTTELSWRSDGASGREESSEVVGIRVVAFDADRGFSVNGERRTLRGVCLHEDAGCLGVAVPAAVWLRRLLALRDMGCNAVRMAHNPHDDTLYALCDALGFFVIDEAFDEWENPKNKWWQGHNVYPPKHEGYATHFPQWHERDLRDMIAAHRNHPSIIAWSIGNEVDYPNDPYVSELFEEMIGNNDADKPAEERQYDPNRPDVRRLTTIARRLGRIVRDADPSRPVTLAAAFPELSSRTGLLDDLDVIGYNYKEHLYADDHRRFPDAPFLGSENGHEYAQWRAVVDNEYIAGQFLWTGIDYLGESHGWPVHGSGAGLLTLAGFPKPGWHLRRSWWSDEPTAHLVVRPSDSGRTGAGLRAAPVTRDWEVADAALEVLVFASGGTPVLIRGGAEIVPERDESDGFWRAVVPASEDPIRLEVRSGDGVLGADEVHPRAEASAVSAQVWAAPETARRRCIAAGIRIDDVAQIECRLVDDEGRPAGGDRPVQVEADGAALLGIENGDLADTTAYGGAERRTFGGRAIVYVGAQASAVRVGGRGMETVTVHL